MVPDKIDWISFNYNVDRDVRISTGSNLRERTIDTENLPGALEALSRTEQAEDLHERKEPANETSSFIDQMGRNFVLEHLVYKRFKVKR